MSEQDELIHYGIPRRSGRYPWGSGKDPYQSASEFLSYVKTLKDQGLSEAEIASTMGISISQLRSRKTLSRAEKREGDAMRALSLLDKGYSKVAIGEAMGINESSVRALLDPALRERALITTNVAKVLRDGIAEKQYIDIGSGVEAHLGVSRTKLMAAVDQLTGEGYTVHYIQTPQLGTDKMTSIMVLAPPDTNYSDIAQNKEKISLITDHYSVDGGRTMLGIEPPKIIDPSRVDVRYNEDGGGDKDGVIELRRGVEDISLGNAKYAQVRIAIGDSHYAKGMAIYSDDLPDGVDVLFNTSKSRGQTKLDAFKSNTDLSDNPFGADVYQKRYIDKNGKEQLSALNYVNEEGAWSKWSNTISSQMLSKQSHSLAKKQLDLLYAQKEAEFKEIQQLTNPVVKKRLLEAFSSDIDNQAVQLKAAAMPRQSWAVLLPFPTMKPDEIYAPNHRDGEKVALIRYPHGGIFEIPELTVNNRFSLARKLLGQAKDAVGIHPDVAKRLSGADYDGDAVLVIPNNNKEIKTSPALKGLKDFDPREQYKGYDGMERMDPSAKGFHMGNVSNLITDMTVKGATSDEIARAVRHSMVVIDAAKHGLDYKRSYSENGIAELKTKYQGSARSGASTIISRASAVKRVKERKPVIKLSSKNIDPKTGKLIYEETGNTYVKDGKTYFRLQKTTKMAEVSDAFSLSSGSIIEGVYATHANKLKALANSARKLFLSVPNLVYSPSARVTYRKEVESLQAKLNLALMNSPLERKAQVVANAIVSEQRKLYPGIKGDALKRLRGQALNEGRLRTGAKKPLIQIEPKEWNAIQAGAISNSMLERILINADLDQIKSYATPRATNSRVTPAIEARARALLKSGYTQAEVADAIGVSVSTISSLNE